MREVTRGRARLADANHQVVTTTVKGGNDVYRRAPCAECPWRRDAPAGAFPAKAYMLSAHCAHDCSDVGFGCHMSGVDHSVTCAGFLLRGADHNLFVRKQIALGGIDLSKVSDGGAELYEDYVEMAIANGVAADDPALRNCRRAFDCQSSSKRKSARRR